MIGSRIAAVAVVGIAGVILLQPARTSAQWWSRSPADFEECADSAEKSANKEDKTAALAECNAKFAGRRKPSGGYTYYDFMQERSFDIKGPNPTAEEQKYIDEQYTFYLEKQRRNSIVAALAVKQQQQQQQQAQLQPVSLRSEAVRVPLPQARPSKLRKQADCSKHEFSCEWPKLSETINDLKKLFTGTPSKPKKS